MLKVESKRMKLKTKDRGPKPIIGQTEQKWAGNLSFFFIHRFDPGPTLPGSPGTSIPDVTSTERVWLITCI